MNAFSFIVGALLLIFVGAFSARWWRESREAKRRQEGRELTRELERHNYL